ncbi:glycoside hydrolase, partial [Achlya hypogyna]
RNDNVLGIGVSSEAIYRHYIQGGHDFSETDGTEKLIKYVARVRDFTRANGLNFPVTISDVMDAYKYSANLYDAVDVVSANQFSQWETIPVEDGANTMFDRLIPIRAQAVKRGKPIMIMETGWSQAGQNPSILAASPESAARYLKDFLAFADEQNIQYYYFTSFNLAFGGETDFGLIEKNFGVFDEQRKIHPLLGATEVGPRPVAVRLWHNGKVIKVNGANTRNYGRVYLGEPNYGLTGHYDEEIWFYYAEKSMYKSKSSNQCLDTYVDGNGNDVLHVYKCDDNNTNQKWSF